MSTRWCANGLTGEVFSYEVGGNLTDFPRGDYLAYGDALTTGMKSRAEAEAWLREWEYEPYPNQRRRNCGSWSPREKTVGNTVENAPTAHTSPIRSDLKYGQGPDHEPRL